MVFVLFLHSHCNGGASFRVMLFNARTGKLISGERYSWNKAGENIQSLGPLYAVGNYKKKRAVSESE